MLGRTIACCVAAGVLSAASSWAGKAAAFEGKWELDKKKTQSTAAPENFQVEIKEKGDGIQIKSKYREPKSSVYPLLWVGVMTYELDLSADGSEKTNHIGPFTHVSKTNVEGNTMTTDFDVFSAPPAAGGAGAASGGSGAAASASASAEASTTPGQASTPVIQGGKWVRTLSADGREMTLQIDTTASDGRKLSETLVFKKK